MSETETLRAALAACVDAMRRGDMEYCDAHGVELIGDDEWNRALAAGEDALEATEAS